MALTWRWRASSSLLRRARGRPSAGYQRGAGRDRGLGLAVRAGVAGGAVFFFYTLLRGRVWGLVRQGPRGSIRPRMPCAMATLCWSAFAGGRHARALRRRPRVQVLYDSLFGIRARLLAALGDARVLPGGFPAEVIEARPSRDRGIAHQWSLDRSEDCHQCGRRGGFGADDDVPAVWRPIWSPPSAVWTTTGDPTSRCTHCLWGGARRARSWRQR